MSIRYLFFTVFLIGSLNGFCQDKILAVLGSSTAAGTGAQPVDSSFVRLLTAYYRDEVGTLQTTYNLALAGYDPYRAMPSSYTPPAGRPVPDQLRNITRALTLNPDVILVSFASNNYDVYSFEEIKFTLQTIKDSANAAGKVCFISSTQPRTNFTPAARQKLSDIKDSIMKWFGAYAINFYDSLAAPDNTILPQYRYQFDDIHINNAGHRVLFRQVVAKNILSATLPVKLTDFRVKKSNKHVSIQWSASGEEFDTRYTVQRSKDGKNFTDIESVPGKESKNNISYEVKDVDARQGMNYYRLLVTENDRKFYSRIIGIAIQNEISILKIYPVPASDQLTIELAIEHEANAQVQIENMLGNRVFKLTKKLMASSNNFNIPLKGLPTGHYVLRISIAGSKPLIRTFFKK